MNTKYHFVREQLEIGTIILEQVYTKNYLGDIFTLPLSNAQFNAITSPFMTNVHGAWEIML